MYHLRPKQRRTLDDLYDWFRANQSGNPIIDAAVGAGKSIMLAWLCHEVSTRWSTAGRVLMITPSKELCEQNLEKLRRTAPTLSIAVCSASMGRKETHADTDVVIGTIGTLYRQGKSLGTFDLILIDECHLVNRNASGMYRKLIALLAEVNPSIRTIGWTGTPFRGNGIWLTDGDERLFTDIASRLTMRELLDDGMLSPLVNAKSGVIVTSEGLDTDSTGDFKIAQVAQKIDQPGITEEIADEIVRLGSDRKRWLVYCVTVQHAEHMTTALYNRGIAVDLVHAGTTKDDRNTAIKGLRSGDLRCLVNVACLTTGLDVPEIDLIALARNTQSPVLITQIAGRGMRVSPGKENCLWLDFTDTTARMGPIDVLKGRNAPPRNPNKEGIRPYKICPNCGSSNPTGAAACHTCGQVFPAMVSSVYTDASNAPVLSDGAPDVQTVKVDSVTCSVKKSKSGNEYLKVMFFSDINIYEKALMIGHPTVGKRALREFQSMTTVFSVPQDPKTAFNLIESNAVQFRKINSIDVNMSHKYKEIVGIRYA